MSEKQEKVWVVMRWKGVEVPVPVKVFDDRADARDYEKRMTARRASRVSDSYWVVGVKKG